MLLSETERKFRWQGGKPKATGDVAVAYIEGVLGLPTQIPSVFPAGRSRSLFSDSLLGDKKASHITSCMSLSA